jgi:hypothetical protein
VLEGGQAAGVAPEPSGGASETSTWKKSPVHGDEECVQATAFPTRSLVFRERAIRDATGGPMDPMQRALELLRFPFEDLQHFDRIRAGACTALAIVLVGVGLYRGGDIALMLCGLGLIGVAGYLFWSATKKGPDTSLAIRVLRDDPRRIVWVYEVAAVRRQTSSHVLTDFYFCFGDGTHDAVTVSKVAGDELAPLLRHLLPWATFGLSDELAARYRVDPRSLARPT